MRPERDAIVSLAKMRKIEFVMPLGDRAHDKHQRISGRVSEDSVKGTAQIIFIQRNLLRHQLSRLRRSRLKNLTILKCHRILPLGPVCVGRLGNRDGSRKTAPVIQAPLGPGIRLPLLSGRLGYRNYPVGLEKIKQFPSPFRDCMRFLFHLGMRTFLVPIGNTVKPMFLYILAGNKWDGGF
jgi:hypothetical protein